MNPTFLQWFDRDEQKSNVWRMALLLVLIGRVAGAQDAAPAAAPTPANPPTPLVTIQADQATARVSPILYGLMTEEINYSYDGGLYGELVNNRSFRPETNNMRHWQLVQPEGAANSMSVVSDQPLNDAQTNSLKLEVAAATESQPVGIANDGFWGIPVRPHTEYHASFYAKAAGGFTGPVTVSLVRDGANAAVFAAAQVSSITADWKKYALTLTTGEAGPSKDNHLLVSVAKPGTIYFTFVSLFPPTFNNRPNGNRPDLMQLLADMKPSFLRFPGGNYLEGRTFANRFNWKNTIHDISRRPGHLNDGWGYWSTDGMGLLEFLEWCEDLHMQPVLAIYAGYSMASGGIEPGPDLDPYVQDGLDEIEYVTGGPDSTWGGQRIADGHPASFALNYVEIGNEDNLGTGPRTYDGRFTQFFKAIKAKYPRLQVIATSPRVTNSVPDLIDEHLYPNTELDMESRAHNFDSRPRTGQKVFVGEWATRVGRPTPTMAAALGDAAWMTGMERNSDLVIISSYAPLLVNVSDLNRGGSMQWPSDLIGYDALGSYGSPSYYAQKIFSNNHGDQILPTTTQDFPTRPYQAAGRRGGGNPPPPRQVPTLFVDATRDSQTKAIYLKVVNSLGAPQEVHFQISGLSGIEPSAKSTVLSAENLDDTNTIDAPKKVVPVATTVTGVGKSFTRAFPPYSVTVLILQGT